MSGGSPRQRGLRSKTSELNLFRDRSSNPSRLHSRRDRDLVPPVPSLVTPDSNKPKRKLALWGKRRKSGSVSPSQSARPSGDSVSLLRKPGETSISPQRTVYNLFTRQVYTVCWGGVVLTDWVRVVARILLQQGYLRSFPLWMYPHRLSTSLPLCLHSHLAIKPALDTRISSRAGSTPEVAAHLLSNAPTDPSSP